MKPTLYLETTIPSYLVSRPSRDLIIAAHQQVTREWWDHRRRDFDVVTSRLVLDEASVGDQQAAGKRLEALRDMPVLELNADVISFAQEIMRLGCIPERAGTDSAHISVCAVYGVDFMLTWNCRHIANGVVIAAVRKLCDEAGYAFPVVCTPDSLLEPMS